MGNLFQNIFNRSEFFFFYDYNKIFEMNEKNKNFHLKFMKEKIYKNKIIFYFLKKKLMKEKSKILGN